MYKFGSITLPKVSFNPLVLTILDLVDALSSHICFFEEKIEMCWAKYKKTPKFFKIPRIGEKYLEIFWWMTCQNQFFPLLSKFVEFYEPITYPVKHGSILDGGRVAPKKPFRNIFPKKAPV